MDCNAATGDAPPIPPARRPSSHTARHVQSRLGQAIRRRRQLMGLSLIELAGACGVSFQQVQKYELGVSRISAAQLWKIASPLGVPVGYFYESLRSPDPR